MKTYSDTIEPIPNPTRPPEQPIRIQGDECLDANGFTTLRPYDGSPNGNTDAQPIATVYEPSHAAYIVKAANEYPKLKAQIEKAAETWAARLVKALDERDQTRAQRDELRSLLHQACDWTTGKRTPKEPDPRWLIEAIDCLNAKCEASNPTN